MKQHRVKHLEPIYIGYINEYKDALVTEDGSKFYSNDLVYHKSIDIMIQKLSEKDKELVIVWSKTLPIQSDPSEKGIFYLNEKEFDGYCAQSLKYLENSDSQESRFVRNETMKNVQQDRFYELYDQEIYSKVFPNKFQGTLDDDIIIANLKRRRAPNDRRVDGREVIRTLTMLELSRLNISKMMDEMSNLKRYQSLNKGREVIMRIMCDRRIEDYDEWFLCCEEIREACSSILKEEGRLEAKLTKIQMWSCSNLRAKRHFTPVKVFKEFLTELDINHDRIVLVPDAHFMRQWIELPLKVDYTCVTILGPDGKEYYRPIQAQLRLFECLACDIDWEDAIKKDPKKIRQMQSKLIHLLETCQKSDFHQPEVIEMVIDTIHTDSFFAESNKKEMNTPLYICRQKNYNDSIPLSEFKPMFKSYYPEIMTTRNEFWSMDKIEMWKVRFLFSIRWIYIVLVDKHEKLELYSNLMAALTMQIGIVNLKDDKDIKNFCMANNPDRFLDYDKIKVFEEMAENSRIEKLDAPIQDVSQEPTSKTPNKKKKKKTIDEVAPEVSKVKGCPSCDEKEKTFNTEVEILNRQLAEKSKLLEDQGKRLKNDEMKIQNLQKELEKSKNMIAQQEENTKAEQKTLRDQANKVKQDYKAENQKLKHGSENKDKRIKQLEKELKESRENAKNERKKMTSEADSESKITDKNMKKIKAELEMAKLTEKTNSKKINKLEKDNRDFQIQIEILKEQSVTSSINHEKDEKIRNLVKECDDLKLVNIGLLADVEDLSSKNRGLDNLTSENHDLMIEIDRLKRLSLAVETNMCPLNNAPLRQLENHLEDKENIRPLLQNQSENRPNCPICLEDVKKNDKNVCQSCQTGYHKNCLSKWLGMSSTCPSCRLYWPNPQEFPAL